MTSLKRGDDWSCLQRTLTMPLYAMGVIPQSVVAIETSGGVWNNQIYPAYTICYVA